MAILFYGPLMSCRGECVAILEMKKKDSLNSIFHQDSNPCRSQNNTIHSTKPICNHIIQIIGKQSVFALWRHKSHLFSAQ
jgi:hypothetical protein